MQRPRVGCSVETIDPPQPPKVASAVILTSTQGAQAASQLAQTRELVWANTQLLKYLGDFAVSVVTHGSPNQNTDITCTDGGAFQYSGTETNGNYSLTLQFNGCSTDSNSWLRISDVRVNADGTIDVLAPDPSLTPWH